ncbi:MAG TPA: isoleucine--tRNA ligase [Candidatus Aphodomonas merdavium]|nr:isoleucine--tRNA ligase [Candidatus Aphodomonas merdavium]
MFNKVDANMDFLGREKEVLAFWKENDIFRKSLTLRDGCPDYTFYDGPPTANGKPHIGHVLTRAMKDLVPRYRTMKGYSVLRKAGWDTHGLPVELEVEKQLGLDGKEQIEAYGIKPFIQACKESVWKYLHEWEEMSDAVGFWCDMEHPYVTYHNDYIESEWWAFKQIYEKGLLYKGHKVVPYCPRCGTALSSHEVAQGYKNVKEKSAFVRFRVKGCENEFIWAWTTTPWTLPSNVALCVNAQEDYTRFRLDGETAIMADALLPAVLGDDFARAEKIETVKGEALVGLEYEPLWDAKPKEKAYYVVADGYVTLTDGTGIVHIAPAFGEDDSRVGHAYGLPFVQLVDAKGCFVKGTKWEGRFVKECDPDILKELAERGNLIKAVDFAHDYPFCWRCDTPLLYYARESWFIKMTAVRDALMANSRSVNWMPENIKEGRMGNFLENVIDWGVSRERYWGTPLPIWICPQGHVHVVGSVQELREMGRDVPEQIELHRPYIDNVVLTCPQCGEEMHRVKEVCDCWFDSGSMPFAQWHYPFENKERFEELFPAQFICEAVDQTRGWFYTLLAISTLLFGRAPFENCLVLGHVQDMEGRKMSKHLGNVVAPSQVLEKQGADAVRWYFYTIGAPWLPSRFSAEAVGEMQRKFMGTLWNTYAFFVLYANIDAFDPKAHPLEAVQLTLMDKWLLSRLNSLVKYVDEGMEAYKITETARAIAAFVDELSNWYVRRGRERFWGKGMEGSKEAAFATLYHTLLTLCKLLAPYTPFLAEHMYQNLARTADPDAPESVHFCDFPACDTARVDTELEKNMEALLKVVQAGRACRSTANMKVRQPAAALYVKGVSFPEDFAALARDELNVKSVQFVEDARAFTTYTLKPQLRTLGKKYGRLLNGIREALAAMDGNEVVDAFARGELVHLLVDGNEVVLEEADVLTSPAQKSGFVAQTDAGVTVVLDTNLTPELVREGYAREIVSKVQTMRKDAGFDVTDRIGIAIACGETLQEAVDAAREDILRATLGVSLAAQPADGAEWKEWNINGETAKIAVWKA